MISIFIHLRHAKPGMILARDLTARDGSLLLEQGLTLTEGYLRRLERLGITAVYVQDLSRQTVSRQSAISPKLRQELTACFRSLYSTKVNTLAISPVQSIYFRQMAAATEKVIDELATQLDNILDVALREPSIDETAHAINVCLLSVVTGLHLKYPRPALQNLAIGALLHDTGRLVLTADGTDPHNDQPELHPVWGQLLLSQNNFSADICRIAAEHHEHYDGSGFPAGKSHKETSELSRLVAITNHYDDIITKASMTDTLRTESVEQMMALGNSHFDLHLLNAFFRTIAIFPLGSRVRLSSGQIGHVLHNHTNLPFRPTVRVAAAETTVDLSLMHHPSITIVELIEE